MKLGIELLTNTHRILRKLR